MGRCKGIPFPVPPKTSSQRTKYIPPKGIASTRERTCRFEVLLPRDTKESLGSASEQTCYLPPPNNRVTSPREHIRYQPE